MIIRAIRFLAIFAGLSTFVCAPLAHGAGTVSKCDEKSLRTALKGGGNVTFGCSGTITLSSTLNIAAKTTIDGNGHSVILSGGNSVGVIAIGAGITVTLKNLTIQEGRTSSGIGGGISNSGTLIVTNCHFGGGSGTGNVNAIENAGSLTVQDSRFDSNVGAVNGGAILHTGKSLLVTGTSFNGNSATNGGAIAIEQSGTNAEIDNSTFASNSAFQSGGAIVAKVTTLKVNNAGFVLNTVQAGGTGGAIANLGSTVTVTGTFFDSNQAANNPTSPGLGGAIYNAGGFSSGPFRFFVLPTLTVKDGTSSSTFSSNTAGAGGAIFSAGTGICTPGTACGTTTVTNTTFSGNTANFPTPPVGGAIDNGGKAQLSVTGSTFVGNASSSSTGGGSDIENNGTLNVSNSTFFGTLGEGFSVGNRGSAVIAYGTLAGSTEEIVNADGGSFTLESTILAATGFNCSIQFAPFINDGGYNLENGTFCMLSSANHSLSNTNPKLGPLANNGGPTQTFSVPTGSPAIDQIPPGTLDCGVAPPKGGYSPGFQDQRNVRRPQGSGCDIGAVEHLFANLPPSGAACNGTYNKTFNGDITVSPGQSCVFLGGGITGNVRVEGGHFELRNATVGGDVEIEDDSTFDIGLSAVIKGNLEIHHVESSEAPNQVCGANVQKELEFRDNESAVQIGSTDTLACPGNTIGGNLEVHNNSAATTIAENTVSGDLLDRDNSGPTHVFNNVVTEDLVCRENSEITSGGNIAEQIKGQCVDSSLHTESDE